MYIPLYILWIHTIVGLQDPLLITFETHKYVDLCAAREGFNVIHDYLFSLTFERYQKGIYKKIRLTTTHNKGKFVMRINKGHGLFSFLGLVVYVFPMFIL